MDKKRVNIYPRRPINTNPPIRMPVLNRTKNIKDIRMAIMSDAKVEEILPDGSVVLLNISNYDVDNSGKGEKRPTAKKPEPKAAELNQPSKPELPIKEEPKEEPKPKVEEPERPIEQLSKKQRKALERQQKEEAAAEEAVEVKDPE